MLTSMQAGFAAMVLGTIVLTGTPEFGRQKQRPVDSCSGWTFEVRRVTDNQELPPNAPFFGEFYVKAVTGTEESCYNAFVHSGTGPVDPGDGPWPAGHTFASGEIGDSVQVIAEYVTASTTGSGQARLAESVGGNWSKIVVFVVN